MRSPLNKLMFLALLAPIGLFAACGDDSTSPGADLDAGGDDTARPDTEDTSLDLGIDIGDDADATEDTAPDTIVPDISEDTPEQDTGGPARCGNGIRENGETCDGDDLLPGVTCQSQGFAGGDIACSASCSFDVSDCYEALCGDGIISGDETCDGANTNGATCQSEGFAPGGEGTVGCDAACQLDTSTCEVTICGNDNIEADYEACDGAQFGDESCRSRGFFAGDLACSSDCANIDDAACVTNICGNNTVEGPEACDGSLAAITCRDVVNEAAEGSGGEPVYFAGGLIACGGDCLAVDTSGCVATTDELGSDLDGDGIADADDNCVEDANPRQLDFDGNGRGNVCDEPVQFAVLVGDAVDNALSTNAGLAIDLGGLFPGGAVSLPLELQVSDASFFVAFDDEGAATTTEFFITIGESVTEFDLSGILGGGGGFPLPIPLPTSLPITVIGGSLELDSESFATAGDFADYIGGVIDGDNAAFVATFNLDVDAADAGASSVAAQPVDVGSSTSVISLWDQTYALTFADDAAAMGALELQLSLGGAGLPIPLGFPITVELTGLTGTVTASID